MHVIPGLVVLACFGMLQAKHTAKTDNHKVSKVQEEDFVSKGELNVTPASPKVKLNHAAKKRPVRNALTDPDFLWPNGRIPIVLDENMPAFTKIEILAAMQEIEMSTYSNGQPCVMYVPRSSEDDYVHISWTNDTHGSASVGRIGGRQDITVDSTSRRGHDDNLFSLMVTLGLVPEIMRTDRNTYININITNVATTEPFRILTGEGSSTFGQPFDYESILLQTPYTYALDATYPVTSATEPGHVLGQSVSLTTGDATLLQQAYGCGVDSSNVINLLGDIPINCHFHQDTCTLQQDKADDFDWLVQEGPTATYGTGPNADYSSGSGSFALAEARGHYGMVAALSSGDLPAGEYCVRVQVHMFGKDVGKLRITIQTANGRREILHQNGSLPKNNWYHLYLTFSSKIDFYLLIEATMGNGDEGDIAIDDFYLYNGECIEW